MKLKIKLILDMPPPTNTKQLQGFTCYEGCDRRFIKMFTKNARPLNVCYLAHVAPPYGNMGWLEGKSMINHYIMKKRIQYMFYVKTKCAMTYNSFLGDNV